MMRVATCAKQHIKTAVRCDSRGPRLATKRTILTLFALGAVPPAAITIPRCATTRGADRTSTSRRGSCADLLDEASIATALEARIALGEVGGAALPAAARIFVRRPSTTLIGNRTVAGPVAGARWRVLDHPHRVSLSTRHATPVLGRLGLVTHRVRLPANREF